MAPPPELIVGLKAITQGAQGGNIDFTACDAPPSPYEVPFGAGAEQAYQSVEEEEDSILTTSHSQPEKAVMGRMAENTIKLATVRAISRSTTRPVIEASDIVWANMLFKHCAKTLLRDSADNVLSDNTVLGRNAQKLLKALRTLDKPSTAREIGRKANLLVDPADRDKALKALESVGKVISEAAATTGKGGQPTVRYKLPT